MPGAVNTAFVLDMQRKLYWWSSSVPSEGHLRRQPHAESRMLGNLHVRFGERDGETWLREGLKRFIPTLR